MPPVTDGSRDAGCGWRQGGHLKIDLVARVIRVANEVLVTILRSNYKTRLRYL